MQLPDERAALAEYCCARPTAMTRLTFVQIRVRLISLVEQRSHVAACVSTLRASVPSRSFIE
jgi:hypothetical protein